MLETFRIALGYSATKQLDLKDGIGYQCHRVADANFSAAVTENLLLADSQLMASMTTDSLNFGRYRNRNFGRYRNR
jgi:hypothetical protein